MTFSKATIDDVDVAGKRVLVRVDFNVPMVDGAIVDDRRIRAAVPTIEQLCSRGAKVLLVTHLGRPKGHDEQLSTKPLAQHLGVLMGLDVVCANDVIGPAAQQLSASLKDGEVGMLENVRYESGEEGNSDQFAHDLSRLGDLYCNDAFGTAHRAHASTAGIAKYLQAVAGPLMVREVTTLQGVFDNPERPLVAIIGGAKVSTKMALIHSLLEKVDTLWIGGAMACTFFRAQGNEVGTSLVEPAYVHQAADLLNTVKGNRVKLKLPVDMVIALSMDDGSGARSVDVAAIPVGYMALDIGPKTVAQIGRDMSEAKVVVWNGPLGVYEKPPFDAGTAAVAKALSQSSARSIVGGGDLAAALEMAGLADTMSFVSTGGGATLEFLEGNTLPGIAALCDRTAVVQ